MELGGFESGDPFVFGVALAALVSGVAFAGFLAGRRRSVADSPVDGIVRDLCALNAQVAADADLAALLTTYVEAPGRLDRVERVRARAWFDSARRLHALLAESLAHAPDGDRRLAAYAPTMGEGAGARSHDDGPMLPRVSNVTLIDPEFMAWVESMQARHRA